MARKKQETLVLFPEILAVTRKFTDEQFGVLVRAAFSYRLNGDVYSGDDVAVDVAFQIVANQIDRYQEYCSTMASNARGSKLEQNAAKYQQKHPPIQSISNPILSNIIDSEADKPLTSHRFSPPSADDVRLYCQDQGYSVNAERFVDHYESNGWMVGKNRMKDWKAAVRNWNRKEQTNNGRNEKAESKQVFSAIGTVV